MGLAVNGTQAFHRDVGIDLGTREGRVAQEFLHRAKLGSPIKQVGGKAVTEDVRAQPGSPGDASEVTCDHPLHGLG